MIKRTPNHHYSCLLLLYVTLYGFNPVVMISITIPAFRIGYNNNNNNNNKISGVSTPLDLLSNKYLENDLVAIQRNNMTITATSTTQYDRPRLCAVTRDGGVIPLCIRLDDVETDLFGDPRQYFDTFWSIDVTDNHVYKGIVFGEGFYGQRPVPSLGGGPGYGAMADEVWSVTIDLLDTIRSYNDESGGTIGIELPTLDVGIAHGEKARGGSF